MSQTVLKNQRKLLFLVAGGIVAAALFLFYAFNDDSHSTIAAAPEKLELPGDTINPQEIWMTRLENENKILKKQMEYFEKILLEIKQAQEEKKQTSDCAKTEIVKLKDELKRALTKPFRETREKNTAEEDNRSGRPVVFTEDPFVSVPHAQQNDEQPVRALFKEAVMGKAKRNVLHIDKAIPAGTSVKAVLISSIDAPCGIYSRTEPQPIKLRILDNGHLPKEVEAKLKGGLIIASAYGDISTERVYMRIERMSKVESNGEFLETSVTGFISGEDGKFGVRGTVIDKSEKIVANAARSGFLGGIGSILQSAVGKHDVNQFSLDIIRQGCAGGASNAFDMLADYYIKRAEQVVPVIQVTAGRIVDITFTHQTELGDLHTKNKVKEIREQSRRIEQ